MVYYGLGKKNKVVDPWSPWYQMLATDALRMRPYTYEASLLQLQFNQRKGVFACPGYDVFSNQDGNAISLVGDEMWVVSSYCMLPAGNDLGRWAEDKKDPQQSDV